MSTLEYLLAILYQVWSVEFYEDTDCLYKAKVRGLFRNDTHTYEAESLEVLIMAIYDDYGKK